MSKPVTIVEVAELAGVSTSAVSRAFNPSASCSDSMRKKVMQAAEQLGYKPNRLARGIRSQSRLIGILVTDFENPVYLPVLSQFTQQLQQQGYHTLLINVGDGFAIQEAVELVMEYQVDGLIITSSTLPPKLVDICHQQNTPVIVFGRYSRNSPVTAVCSDNIAAGTIAADTLIQGGYQRFAYISGVPGATTSLDRQRGFITRLVEQGYEQWQITEAGQHSYDAGYQTTLRLFQQSETEAPNALFFATDIMACGGMDALRYELGLNIPNDVGVVGMDDIPMASSKAYQLTTISQPFDTMVEACIHHLLEQITSKDIRHTALQITLPGHLKQRHSCRKNT